MHRGVLVFPGASRGPERENQAMRKWTERLTRLASFLVLCILFMKEGCLTIRGNLSPAEIAFGVVWLLGTKSSWAGWRHSRREPISSGVLEFLPLCEW